MVTSRRSFIKNASLASAPFILPSRIRAAETKPNDKPRMAFIGFGIQARGLLRNFLHQDVSVVAMCDVDTTRREDAVKRVDDFYKTHPDSGIPGACKG
ncbi:MAG: gfo/Idh/MocA family oxidoreductase, partial [Kiritimatiellae bacterium]|nr:gfo/Idh/MocA family oxidoreductase [Kiritimatiellia bacterium]